MRTLDLPAAQREIVQRLLAEHLPEVEVWAFGSRVTHSGHSGSDLDLVLRPPTRASLPPHKLSALRNALTASDLPILVEVHDWNRLPEPFQREIERAYVIVQKPAGSFASSDGRAP